MHRSRHHVEEVKATENKAQYEEDDNVFGEAKIDVKDFKKPRPTRRG